MTTMTSRLLALACAVALMASGIATGQRACCVAQSHDGNCCDQVVMVTCCQQPAGDQTDHAALCACPDLVTDVQPALLLTVAPALVAIGDLAGEWRLPSPPQRLVMRPDLRDAGPPLAAVLPGGVNLLI